MAETTSTFASELSHEHASLLSQVSRVAEAAEGRTTAGALVNRLKDLQQSLRAHLQFEEQGGYMSRLLADAPHLEHTAQKLLAEHRVMADGLQAIITAAAALPAASSIPAALQKQVGDWSAQVRAHEARETQLVQQAYNQDVGAED